MLLVLSHLWSGETAMSEFPDKHLHSASYRGNTPSWLACSAWLLCKSSSCLAAAPSAFHKSMYFPSSPILRTKDIIAIHVMIAHLLHIHLRWWNSINKATFPNFHLISLKVLICPSWWSPTGTELNWWEKKESLIWSSVRSVSKQKYPQNSCRLKM